MTDIGRIMIAATAVQPRWNKREALPPLAIRPITDRASIVHFVSCLPANWIGHISSSEKRIGGLGQDGPFAHVLRIWFLDMSHQSTTSPVFAVYFNKDFTCVQIYFKARSWTSGDGGLFIAVIPDMDATMLCLPEPVADVLAGSRAYSSHPYILLGRRLASRWLKGVVDVSGRDIFSWNVTQSVEKRRQRDTALRDFFGRLNEIGLGSVQVYASEHSGYAMPPITDDLSLYGLTAVFPWAVHMLADICPNCTMLDGTFRILKPYVLEILNVIVANESIPIAIAVFPSETEQSYEFLYGHVEMILARAQVRDPAILSRLPLVSDQGSGLRAFATHRNLPWKHCHRHLIEAAGANSQIGDWVARLLQCSSEEQYGRVADCIRFEIAHMESIQESSSRAAETFLSPKFRVVRMMLGAEDADEMHQLDQWAKWRRFGCPSTSNASESIHAKLNAIAGQGRSFLARLSLAKVFLFRRFAQRNSAERIQRRSSNRFLARLHGSASDPLSLERDLRGFLWHLNTIVGEPEPRANWQFPDFPSLHLFPSTVETQVVPFLPPDRWKVVLLAQVPANPPEQCSSEMDRLDLDAETIVGPDELRHDVLDLQAEQPLDVSHALFDELFTRVEASEEQAQEEKQGAKQTMLSRARSTGLSDHVGWQIVRSIRRFVTQEQWESSWPVVIETVFTIGGEIQQGFSIPPTGEDEAKWRMTVLTRLALL
jgi:hypothetical protein